jgi:rhodanese-related sulfurtransferase
MSRLADFFGMNRRSSPVRDLNPAEVARGLTEGTMVIVDVREPPEVSAERIAGSLFVPLSTFDPRKIPDPQGRTVVFLCAAGVRSIKASQAAQEAGLPYDAHIMGGLKAWKAAGLPVEG